LRPDFFGSNALLGATLYALREDETAYEILDRAHSLNPEDGDTANLLFQESLILAGREEAHQHYELARTYLEKARRLRPDDGGVLQRLSAVSRHLDNPQTKSPK
jgi:tetratricopeptide (TPR) repeat protein